MNTNKVSTFPDLEAYQTAREFRKAMYQVAKGLPEFEKFNLISQIRRAALFLTNNIAEGHGRYHYPDQIRFTLQSRGSVEELVDDLNACLDEEYLPAKDVDVLKQHAWKVRQLVDGYIRYLRQRNGVEKSSTIHETSPDDVEVDLSANSRFTIHDSP